MLIYFYTNLIFFFLGILTVFSLIVLNAHTFYTQRKLREMKKEGLNLLCKSKLYFIKRNFLLKNYLNFTLLRTIVAYEPEEPEEFAYDYDPKQEKRDDDNKKESLKEKIKTYIYYDQSKKGILDSLK